jgi:hypothetical protein
MERSRWRMRWEGVAETNMGVRTNRMDRLANSHASIITIPVFGDLGGVHGALAEVDSHHG